jgi:Ca2+-binding EF-hand superfamily protein
VVRAFQAHDRDGDGLVTVEEFGRRFDHMVIRFDQDGDGEITVDEMPRRGERRGGRDGDRERGGDQE